MTRYAVHAETLCAKKICFLLIKINFKEDWERKKRVCIYISLCCLEVRTEYDIAL